MRSLSRSVSAFVVALLGGLLLGRSASALVNVDLALLEATVQRTSLKGSTRPLVFWAPFVLESCLPSCFPKANGCSPSFAVYN